MTYKNFSGKSILLIAHDFPYPPIHGGRYDMFYRLQILRRLGFNLDLISTCNEFPEKEDIEFIKSFINNLFIIKRNLTLRKIFSFKPFQITSRINTSDKVLEKFKDKFYDIIFLEDFFVAGIFEKLQFHSEIKYKKVFIRMHNVNFKYFLELSKSTRNFLLKCYYLSEAYKFSFYESKFIKKVKPVLLPVSYDEFLIIKQIYDKQLSFWLPPALDIKKMKTFRNIEKNFNIVFIGNLFTPNNIDGIKWFLEKVHPWLVKKYKNYRLIIAGKVKRNLPINLHNIPNITFIPNPESLENIYKEALIFINPLRYGSGVKIKNLDAILNGIPVITTSKGNEGTGLRHKYHVFVANKVSEWLKGIEILSSNDNLRKKMVLEAQNFLKRNYNHKEKLIEIMQRALKK